MTVATQVNGVRTGSEWCGGQPNGKKANEAIFRFFCGFQQWEKRGGGRERKRERERDSHSRFRENGFANTSSALQFTEPAEKWASTSDFRNIPVEKSRAHWPFSVWKTEAKFRNVLVQKVWQTLKLKKLKEGASAAGHVNNHYLGPESTYLFTCRYRYLQRLSVASRVFTHATRAFLRCVDVSVFSAGVLRDH